tara:strand:+ start:170 stop:571 length:402 start_codon:yes stop_codon:yes gene_type:complete
MFVWQEKYKTNIKEIDVQHKRLFELGHSMFSMAENRERDYDSEALMDIIEELCEYTIYHFDTEERYFNQHDYEHTSEHVAQHQSFIAFLSTLNIDDIEHRTSDSLNKLLSFINDWIINHVIIEDAKFAHSIVS